MRKLILPFALLAMICFTAFTQQLNTEAVVAGTPVSLGEVVYTVQLRKQVPVEEVQNDWELNRIEAAPNDSLFSVLFEKVRNKELEVYSPVYPFTKKMNADSAKRTISVLDTVEVEDPVTYELMSVAVVNDRLPENVVAVVFHEEWFYDAATLTLDKRVKGIIPIVDYGYYFDGESYSARIQPCFYIPFQSGTGTPESKDINVSDIVYDFKTDSVRLEDYVGLDRFVVKASFKAPSAETVNQNLLASLKAQAKAPGARLYRGTYPNVAVTAKKEKTAVFAGIDSTRFIRFRESWNVQLDRMIFTKRVKGIYPGYEFVKTENQGPYTVSALMKRFPVYLPMNGIVPQLMPAGPVCVENFSFDASFHNEIFRNAEHIRTTDSANLNQMLISMVGRGRSGAMPVYPAIAQWEFNDPLDKRRVPMTPAEIYDVFVDSDLVMREFNGDFEEYYVAREIENDKLSGFEFIERWSYDPSRNSFTKKVKCVGALAYTWADYRETKRTRYLFSYDINNSSMDSLFTKRNLVASGVTSPCIINYCEFHPGENDHSTPVVEYYPTFDEQVSNEQRFLLVQQMINQVLAGKLVAWSTDSIPKPFTVQQFSVLLDTVAARNTMHPVEGKEYYMFNELSFTENWYYNAATGQFGKQVMAITFGHRSYTYDFIEPGEVNAGYFTIKVNGTK